MYLLKRTECAIFKTHNFSFNKMSFLKKLFFIVIPIVGVTTSIAQNTSTISIEFRTEKLRFGLDKQIPNDRPIVAVALSGGGSRGLAQIGVLRALEEAGIPIDMIVGTSMGSIIGGLYASGYSINQLDSIVSYTDWDGLLSPDRETERRELFIDQKITEDKAIFALRLQGFNPVIPTSLNTGHKLSNYLNLLTLQAPIHVKESFDDLKIKFRAVCTDLVSGSSVVLDRGSLSQAMRASSSVSFFIAPVKMDSLILVDGGLVANIPVKIALELGADIVIAINTTSELHSREDLGLPWIIADQVVSIPMKLLNENQLKYADVIIEPPVSNRSATDFKNPREIIISGYLSGVEAIDQIKSKIDIYLNESLSEEEIYFYNIENHSDAAEWEKNLLRKYAKKDSVSSSEIKSDILSMYKSGSFENIKAEISIEKDKTEIRFIAEEYPTIKSVEITSSDILDINLIENHRESIIGEKFNSTVVYSYLINLLNIYRKNGFSLADVRSADFNKKTGKLLIEIEEGLISDIIVEGNESTNENVIKREFPLKEGDYFKYEDIERGLINLRSTNLFEDLILIVNKEEKGNVIVLRVIERTSGLLRVGFRADNENKAQLSLDVRDENLFGTGTEMGLFLGGGTRNRTYLLEHKSNRIFDTYLTYKINAFYEFQDVFTYRNTPSVSDKTFSREREGEYRQIFYGVSVGVGAQVEKLGNLIFKGKYQFDEIKNLQNEAVGPYKNKIVSLKISTTIDSQDRYPYPRNGVYFYGAYESASSFLGGDIGFINLGFDYRSYFTLNNAHTFSPRLMMGFGDKTLPLSQQYSLGGQNSFFGMRDNEFRGRQIFLGSFEYSVLLPFQIFFDTYLKFRYDLGSTWEVQEQIRFKDLRHGLGGSISFNTPMGPADFSIGRSFIFKKNLPESPISWGDVLFYFSIGYYY